MIFILICPLNVDARLHTPLCSAIASLIFIIHMDVHYEGFLFSRYAIFLQSLSGTEYIDLNLFNFNHTSQIYVIHPIFPKPIVYVHVVSCTVTYRFFQRTCLKVTWCQKFFSKWGWGWWDGVGNKENHHFPHFQGLCYFLGGWGWGYVKTTEHVTI